MLDNDLGRFLRKKGKEVEVNDVDNAFATAYLLHVYCLLPHLIAYWISCREIVLDMILLLSVGKIRNSKTFFGWGRKGFAIEFFVKLRSDMEFGFIADKK